MAAALWVGALAGAHFSVSSTALAAGAVALVAFFFRTWVTVLLVVVAVGLVSGAGSAHRDQEVHHTAIVEGSGVVAGVAATDSLPYGPGYRFVLRPMEWRRTGRAAFEWIGPRIAIDTSRDDVVAGDSVVVVGLLRAKTGYVRGDPVAGRMTASELTVVEAAGSPLLAAGNWLRARVQARMSVLDRVPAAALLSGFLIGDVADLPAGDVEALRRSGLTHYVAVSGSNVALVLGAWWLVMTPLRMGTRLRAVTGLVLLAVFVVATRWESSVIRAATMAGLVLGCRAVGWPLDAWTALGAAVSLLLAISGGLAYDVGFQLSVLATAGVLVGMRLWRNKSPRVFWAPLAATVGAQLAVVPVLLVHFGTVPLFSPVANLLAAPLVTLATTLGGFGVVVGWDLPLQLGATVAAGVLQIARIAGEWPQLGPLAVATAGIGAGLSWQTALRAPLVAGIAAVLVLGSLPPGPPALPTVTFLDVGQGDSVLIQDPSGAVALVDGGHDPGVLRGALRRYGINRIDLLIASHGDLDHVGGLAGLAESMEVGRFWLPTGHALSAALGDLKAGLEAAGVAVEEVGTGSRARLGEFAFTVLGPQRRYAADNDGSVVLLVDTAGKSVLLPGDIGEIAQRELPPLAPDILLVPHHGAATTDLEWLEETVGAVAVVSVGINNYGHPHPSVMATLQRAGAMVRVTAEMGDVVVPLGS